MKTLFCVCWHGDTQESAGPIEAVWLAASDNTEEEICYYPICDNCKNAWFGLDDDEFNEKNYPFIPIYTINLEK